MTATIPRHETPRVSVCATYSETWWETEDSEEPSDEYGFTEIYNPWGGLDEALHDDGAKVRVLDVVGAAAAVVKARNSEHMTLIEAAELVLDFPGTVFVNSDNVGGYCDASQDIDTGRWRDVVLHIDGLGSDAVITLSEVIADGRAQGWWW